MGERMGGLWEELAHARKEKKLPIRQLFEVALDDETICSNVAKETA